MLDIELSNASDDGLGWHEQAREKRTHKSATHRNGHFGDYKDESNRPRLEGEKSVCVCDRERERECVCVCV